MPRRSPLSLEDLATLDNLALAFERASRGKRRQPDVLAFAHHLERSLEQLGHAIRNETVHVGRFRSFRIFDPKPRVIHAPVFEERVLHHAVMNLVGPILDRSLVDDTYACRTGKGALAAVHRAQSHLRRYHFYVKVDMRRYFASIDQERLLALLARRFKNPGLLRLFGRILGGFQSQAPAAESVSDGTRAIVGRGRLGLPIGALTSQHFANAYLSPLDRFLLEESGAAAMVRYMDDAVAWCHDRAEAKALLEAIESFVTERLGLTLHPRRFVQRSTQGLSFLGYRIWPDALKPSRRRRRRYRKARARWEGAYATGAIDAYQLQMGYASADAILKPSHSLSFRRRDLAARPPVEA